MSKKEKELIDKIITTSKCRVTPEDIYTNTDFFDKPRYTKKVNPFKLAFLVSVVLMFITLTTSIVLGVQNYQLKNQEPIIIRVEEYIPVIDDTNGMPEDLKLQFLNEYQNFFKYPIVALSHTQKVIFYVYYAYDVDNDGYRTNYYYYAFHKDTINYINSCKISINNSIISVDKNNFIGILTTIDESLTDDFTIEFTLNADGRTCKYVLLDCVFE